MRKTAQKVDEKTLKVRTPDYMPFTPNEVYYLASEQEIFNDGGPREKLTVERFYENDSIVVFKENIRATDVSGFVLMNANLITLGGATRGDYETQTARSLPIILNANELSTRESFYVPAHEVSHMFGLPDVVSEADNNLMTCMTNYWKPTGIPSLKGRPIAQSYTAKEGCPYDEKTNKSISQWDAWIREPKWTF